MLNVQHYTKRLLFTVSLFRKLVLRFSISSQTSGKLKIRTSDYLCYLRLKRTITVNAHHMWKMYKQTN